MPRKTGNGKKQGKAKWIGFAAVPMPVGIDVLSVKEALSHENPFEVISELTMGGYKVALSFDDRVDGWRCSFTGTSTICENPGITLTATGGTPETAIWAAGYKHFVLCEAGEWPVSRQAGLDL